MPRGPVTYFAIMVFVICALFPFLQFPWGVWLLIAAYLGTGAAFNRARDPVAASNNRRDLRKQPVSGSERPRQQKCLVGICCVLLAQLMFLIVGVSVPIAIWIIGSATLGLLLGWLLWSFNRDPDDAVPT